MKTYSTERNNTTFNALNLTGKPDAERYWIAIEATKTRNEVYLALILTKHSNST